MKEVTKHEIFGGGKGHEILKKAWKTNFSNFDVLGWVKNVIFSREATLELAMSVHSSICSFVMPFNSSVKIKRQNQTSKSKPPPSLGLFE